MKKHYKLLDLLRLGCAFLVVGIHLNAGRASAFISCCAQQAVPFFFLASGFFFTKRCDRGTGIMRTALSYAKNVLLVYLFWGLLSMPALIRSSIAADPERSPLFLILIQVRRLLIAGVIPFWYLLVLAEGILLLALTLRRRAYLVGWAACILGLTLLTIYNLHPESGLPGLLVRGVDFVFSWSNNVIMIGFPMLFLGSVFSRCEGKLQGIKWPVLLPVYLLAVIAAFVIFRV